MLHSTPISCTPPRAFLQAFELPTHDMKSGAGLICTAPGLFSKVFQQIFLLRFYHAAHLLSIWSQSVSRRVLFSLPVDTSVYFAEQRFQPLTKFRHCAAGILLLRVCALFGVLQAQRFRALTHLHRILIPRVASQMIVLPRIVDVRDPRAPAPADAPAPAGVVLRDLLRRDDLQTGPRREPPPLPEHLPPVAAAALRPPGRQHVDPDGDLPPAVAPAQPLHASVLSSLLQWFQRGQPPEPLPRQIARTPPTAPAAGRPPHRSSFSETSTFRPQSHRHSHTASPGAASGSFRLRQVRCPYFFAFSVFIYFFFVPNVLRPAFDFLILLLKCPSGNSKGQTPTFVKVCPAMRLPQTGICS